MTDVQFAITGAKAKERAASPAIAFALEVRSGQPIEAMVLRAQVRIEPQWRDYDPQQKVLLNDLFGRPERWGTTLRSFAWADVPVTVPAFAGATQVEIPVQCTYDFDVAATRFMNALDGGEIPLRFLFSGAIFRYRSSGFSTERVPWSCESAFRMPLQVWREALRACYGDDALIRIKRETLDRLQRYRALMGGINWDVVLDNLLNEVEQPGTVG